MTSAAELPAVAQSVVGAKKLSYELIEEINEADFAVRWEVKPDRIGDKVEARGSYRFAEAPGGAERTMLGTVTVRVPLVGGRIDAIFFCPHTNADNCECRKPKAGMYKEIAARMNVDLAGVPAIGDSLRDLHAAVTVGAQPMLVLTGKGRKTQDDPALPPGTPVFPDLAAAVAHIVR